jgi:predicted metal-dependent peptidase
MNEGDLGAWLDAFVRDPGFIARYPYYAAIVGKMQPVADPSIKRMAVSLYDGRFFLHVNVESFVAEPQYLRGVLLHEVHHIALGHLAHPKFLDAAEPELMDLALEMSANEHIEEPLPDPIVWQAYANLGVRAGQSSIERYERLLGAQRSGVPRPRPGAGEAQDDRGRRVDDHRFLRRRAADPGAVEQTRQLLQNAVDEVEVTDPRHDDEDERRRLLAGKSPGRLLEELTGAPGPPRVFLDWKTALRMFVARARAPVHTWSRPSRRFPDDVGKVPGRMWSPRVIVRPSLLVAIDTSMSMSGVELDEIARHLASLGEHARLTIAECDTEIVRTYPFTGTLGDVAGRGGTDLRPIFEPELLGAIKPDGIVYFTDGEGPVPDAPPCLPVLWVLTKPRDFGCPWGERAQIAREARPVSSRKPRSPRRAPGAQK